MGSGLLLFFIGNLLLFSCVFWLLTWAAGLFYQQKNYRASSQFYECGFKALSEVNLQININFTTVCVFLILYDIEFTLLYPAAINSMYFSGATLITVMAFIFFIALSLYYDVVKHGTSFIL